tara:strand:+ start:17 stop:517 length:501 start_codon:yes stop_codon:yes gene_type:complete
MINSLPTLNQLSSNVRYFLLAFIVCLTIGVTVGLVYVWKTTSMSPAGASEHYSGSVVSGDLDIPEKYPKSVESMLLTTHTHVISFAMIFLVLGGIFSLNSLIKGSLKTFVIIEPFITVLGTFGSIWGMRYLSSVYSYLSIIFGVMTYFTFYFMVGVVLYDLILKKN